MIPSALLLKAGPSAGETVAFAAIALVLLGSALATVFAKRTFHAVMFLGAVLVTMGALFILQGSAFVGVIQVLVYVGGILTLFIFAVMFVTGDEEEGDGRAPVQWLGRAIVVGFALLLALAFGLLVLALANGLWGYLAGAVPGGAVVAGLLLLLVVGGIALLLYRLSWPMKVGFVGAWLLFNAMSGAILATTGWGDAEPEGDANDLAGLTDALFGADVIAFEVLGILLTAAMIGALVIARPLDAVEDKDRYSHPTEAQQAETDRVSDVKAARMEGPQ